MDAYSAFRSRDYRLLLAGMFLSNFGMQMLSVAVSWDLYLQTKSALVLGNVGFVQVAPFLLFALFAGHVADRYDRRRTMILAQVLLLAASVPLAARAAVRSRHLFLPVSRRVRAGVPMARPAIASAPHRSRRGAEQRDYLEQQRAGIFQRQRSRGRWTSFWRQLEAEQCTSCSSSARV